MEPAKVGSKTLKRSLKCCQNEWLSMKKCATTISQLTSESLIFTSKHRLQLSEYDEETDKTISNVPKPQKTLKPSSLPFNPAGCPYVFVRGDDRSAMSANKSIVSLRRSTYFAIETISPGSVRFVQIRLRFGTSCLKYYIFVTILR